MWCRWDSVGLKKKEGENRGKEEENRKREGDLVKKITLGTVERDSETNFILCFICCNSYIFVKKGIRPVPMDGWIMGV